MIDDGRLLVLLGVLGLAGTAMARGSRGAVRRGRTAAERFRILTPFSLEERLERGPVGSGRIDTRWTWNVDVPGKGRVHALNLHFRPQKIEAIWDRKTKQVIFWSIADWSPNTQIEVLTEDGDQLMSWNPLDPKERVPFSEELPRLEALMDRLYAERTGSRGVVRAGRAKQGTYKLTRVDFRPRTRPGFYQRGKDVIRIDFVEHTEPQQGRPLGVADWYVIGVATLTGANKDGPSPGTQATSLEMKVYELHQAGYKRMNPDKLKPAWKAWFDKHPKFEPEPFER